MRGFFRILAVATTLVAPSFAAQGAQRPNLLLIFADDWGYGDLGCYGHSELKTPNLDRFAGESTRFTQFYVTSGVCSPSRCSVITGHFPAWGIRTGDWKLLFSETPRRVELFRIPDDPGERNNLADRHPVVVQRLIGQLMQWKGTLPE